jgi:hypothetical protein
MKLRERLTLDPENGQWISYRFSQSAGFSSNRQRFPLRSSCSGRAGVGTWSSVFQYQILDPWLQGQSMCRWRTVAGSTGGAPTFEPVHMCGQITQKTWRPPMAKRGNSAGSITKRTDGRWMARVSLPDGNRKYLITARRAKRCPRSS